MLSMFSNKLKTVSVSEEQKGQPTPSKRLRCTTCLFVAIDPSTILHREREKEQGQKCGWWRWDRMGFLKMGKRSVVWEMSVVRWKVNITANVRQTRNIFRGEIQTDRQSETETVMHSCYFCWCHRCQVSAMMFSDLMGKNLVKVI